MGMLLVQADSLLQKSLQTLTLQAASVPLLMPCLVSAGGEPVGSSAAPALLAEGSCKGRKRS